MYAMNIQNDVIGLVLRQNCKSKQVTDFIAWPSRCHDTIYAEMCPKVRSHNALPLGSCIMPSNLGTYFRVVHYAF